MPKQPTPKQKRYFSKCVYCGNKYESDKPIKPCHSDIAVNDREKLESKIIFKEMK